MVLFLFSIVSSYIFLASASFCMFRRLPNTSRTSFSAAIQASTLCWVTSTKFCPSRLNSTVFMLEIFSSLMVRSVSLRYS